MSEPETKKTNDSTRTIVYMIILSVVCALILSVIASALAHPQATAKELDRSGQMMMAAKILSYDGYFLIKNEKGEYVPGKYTPGGFLAPGSEKDIATNNEILEVFSHRLLPLLVDDKGDIKTFAQAGVDENLYLSQFKKSGYANLPLKLVYKILPNSKETTDPLKAEAEGWVIPINGFGLWDAIYGYLALQPDGDNVIGITWYDQKETPGLGANIATPEWQNEFPGKVIFAEGVGGKTDYKTAPLGITVIKGKVSEVLGDSPKAKNAVDGMAGATLTGNGVTEAYKNCLAPYRPFLIKIAENNKKSDANKTEEKKSDDADSKKDDGNQEAK